MTRGAGLALQIRPPECRSCPHRDVATRVMLVVLGVTVVLGEVLTTLDPLPAGVASSPLGVSLVDSERT